MRGLVVPGKEYTDVGGTRTWSVKGSSALGRVAFMTARKEGCILEILNDQMLAIWKARCARIPPSTPHSHWGPEGAKISSREERGAKKSLRYYSDVRPSQT